MRHDPACGSGHEVFKTCGLSRASGRVQSGPVGSSRFQSGWVGSGRVQSGQEVSRYHGLSRVTPTRSDPWERADPTREKRWLLFILFLLCLS